MTCYIETYGCQMNVADSELVAAILQQSGYTLTYTLEEADMVLINTCSIRDNAEVRIWGRIAHFAAQKKKKKNMVVGVLGCMAERLKQKLLEEAPAVDLIAGPDSYRNLPNLIKMVESGQRVSDVKLSLTETYDDICPQRLDQQGVSAFISIMRGCDNMCAFCVVPFTRGRERSRDPQSILGEAGDLQKKGYKEITLLGQNVDKYNWQNGQLSFAGLLEKVAEAVPEMRIRFATSYPQHMTDDVLHAMAQHQNICRYIHLPVQSGSTRILQEMKRGYTREWYLDRIRAIRSIVPDCAISTDMIAGFCSETEADHQDTLSLMREVGFDYAYMFKYSPRPNTYAYRRMKDDVSEEVKTRRLEEIIALQQSLSLESNRSSIGKTFEVLVEGVSKKSDEKLYGRTSQNKVVVFPRSNFKVGETISLKISDCSSATLHGELV